MVSKEEVSSSFLVAGGRKVSQTLSWFLVLLAMDVVQVIKLGTVHPVVRQEKVPMLRHKTLIGHAKIAEALRCLPNATPWVCLQA